MRKGDNKVCSFWFINESSYGYGPLSASVSAPTAKGWSNLVYKQNGSLYFVDQYGMVSYFRYNNTTRQWDFGSFQTDLIATNSRIAASDYPDHVFYVRANDYRIGNYYNNFSGLLGYGVLDPTGEPTYPKSSLIYTGDQVIYAGQNGNLQSTYFDDCKWVNYQIDDNSLILENKPNLYKNGESVYIIEYKDSKAFVKKVAPPVNENFAYTKGDRFMLKGEPYSPFILAYTLSIYKNIAYNPVTERDQRYYAGFDVLSRRDAFSDLPFQNKAESYAIIKNDFLEIKSWGFDVVRLNFNLWTDGPFSKIKTDTNSDKLFFYTTTTNRDVYQTGTLNTPNELGVEMTETEYLNMIEEVLTLAEEAGLKVMLFTGLDEAQYSNVAWQNYIDYLGLVANRFKDNETIFSYAVLQEPDLYKLDFPTQSVYDMKCEYPEFTESIKNKIRSFDQNHLINIGIHVFGCLKSWDPVLHKNNVDFYDFHMYPPQNNGGVFAHDTGPTDIKIQMKWLENAMKQIKMPWIIGETGFAADTASIYNSVAEQLGTEMEQREYGEFAIDMASKAGATGFTWFAFKDSYYSGVGPGATVSLKTIDDNPKEIVKGNNSIFKNGFSRSCTGVQANDFLYSGNNEHKGDCWKFTGIVKKNENNVLVPVKDAYILGSGTKECGTNVPLPNNEYRVVKAFTDVNGEFTFEANFKVDRIDVYALGKEETFEYWYSSGYPNAILYKGNDLNAVISNEFQFHEFFCSGSKSGLISNFTDIIIEEGSHSLIEKDVVLYPNPTTGILVFKTAESSIVEVFDISGKQLFFNQNANSELSIDLSRLKKGVYLVRIITNSKVFTEKVILE